jgi:hypothetical protein
MDKTAISFVFILPPANTVIIFFDYHLPPLSEPPRVLLPELEPEELLPELDLPELDEPLLPELEGELYPGEDDLEGESYEGLELREELGCEYDGLLLELSRESLSILGED